MFDGLLKSKFYNKCKSDIKQIRTRIEIIKRKRNATQKYLRNDVADLLRDGFDYNAYGRAEGLLAELNRSQCYELIDQYCEHISKHLSAMDKQRECPEECREAASSLMFAAARFADLPELRELRTMFYERYGNSLDCFVNKQFAEKLKSGLPSKDTKLQLLQDIAAESGLGWNSKALENRLFRESAYDENIAKEINDMNGSVQKKDRMGTGYELYKAREVTPEKKKDPSYLEQKEATRNEERLPRKKESASPRRDDISPPLKDIRVDTIGRMAKPNEPAPGRKVPKEEDEDKLLKYSSLAPPYTKSEANKAKSILTDARSDSCKDKVEATEPADAEQNPVQDNPVLKAKQVPKSVRTRNRRPSPGQETSGGSEDDEEERVKTINKEKAAQAQKILRFFDGGGRDQQDAEERKMDKLLKHYSRKKESHKEGKLESDSSKTRKHKSRDGPSRVSSLPSEVTSTPMETPKHTRAASFHPDGHVHPKMPDYDEFVARLAAFRGK